MARKLKFTKDQILKAALDLTREKGFNAVTARAIGERLGASYRPICSYFNNMADIKESVIAAANELYQGYLKNDMASGKYPPYKASGMAYVRFAREEKELFKLLFMRDRTNEDKTKIADETEMLAELISKQVNITKDRAMTFYVEMWAFVHGIATMIATGFYDWSEEFCSRSLTDTYEGLKHKYQQTE